MAASRGANQTAAPEGRADRDWVELGRVLRPHGLAGCLLVGLHSDDPSNLIAAETLRLAGDPGTIPFRVASAESAGAGPGGRARVRLSLVGLDTRDRAKPFVGSGVMIPAVDLAALPEGEFYWRDLIGLQALAGDGSWLGVLAEILPTAAADVLVIRRDGPDLLLPVTERLIARLDRERGELWLDPPDELLAEEPR
ncbi:MAG: ribosome maturation factor RimM [Myxococcota bacterium]